MCYTATDGSKTSKGTGPEFLPRNSMSKNGFTWEEGSKGSKTTSIGTGSEALINALAAPSAHYDHVADQRSKGNSKSTPTV